MCEQAWTGRDDGCRLVVRFTARGILLDELFYILYYWSCVGNISVRLSLVIDRAVSRSTRRSECVNQSRRSVVATVTQCVPYGDGPLFKRFVHVFGTPIPRPLPRSAYDGRSYRRFGIDRIGRRSALIGTATISPSAPLAPLARDAGSSPAEGTGRLSHRRS